MACERLVGKAEAGTLRSLRFCQIVVSLGYVSFLETGDCLCEPLVSQQTGLSKQRLARMLLLAFILSVCSLGAPFVLYRA